MGGSPSKKSNFQECILTQESIDIIYNNFCEFSKLKDSKSGTYISSRGLQKVVKPNKTLGRKIHEFLAQQSVTQTLNFETFLYFVEFFLQGSTFIRQDLRYREYTIVEMFGLLSFYSNLTKNKQTDKEYINRLHINFRAGLEFFKELHGVIGALNGIYEPDRDETIPKRLTTLIFGNQYEITFQDFIAGVKQHLPNVDKIIQSYFRRTFYQNKPYKKVEGQKENSNSPPKSSELLNHNTLSNLTLQVNLFSEFPYRENVYNAQQERYDFESLTKAIQMFSNCNLLLLVSHNVNKQPNEEEDDLLQRTKMAHQTNKERQVLGVYLPKYKSQSESFFQLQPSFQIYSNTTGKQNFFNMDQTAIVIFFGEEEQDLLFLHNELNKQSYIKSNKPEFIQNSDQPTVLNIDQIELWVLSDDPIDTSILKNNRTTTTTVVEQQIVSPQPQVTYTTTTPGVNQVQSTKTVVVERNVQQDYYITSSNPQYYGNVGIKDVR